MADTAATVSFTTTVPAPSAPRTPLASRRYALEIRQQMAWHRQALILAVALVAVALFVAGLIALVNWIV